MKEYWNAITKSKLLGPKARQAAAQFVKSLSPEDKKDRSKLGLWLMEQGWISSYHHENLMMSLPGPFQFGPIQIHGQLPGPSFQDCYAARIKDAEGNWPVPSTVSFLDEEQSKTVEGVARLVDSFTDLPHPHLLCPLGFYQNGSNSLVVQPPAEFWEKEVPSGFWEAESGNAKPLSQLLRARSGFKSKSSLQIAADTACGLAALEEKSVNPFFLSPDSLIIGPGSRAVIRLTPQTGLCGQAALSFFSQLYPDSNNQIGTAPQIGTGRKAPPVKIGDRPPRSLNEIMLFSMQDRSWTLADYLPLEVLQKVEDFQAGNPLGGQCGQELASRVNQFSLGAMLFQMLTGMLPYQGETLEEKIADRESQPELQLRSLPKPLPEKIVNLVAGLLKGEKNLTSAKVATMLYKALGSVPLASNPYQQQPNCSQVKPLLTKPEEDAEDSPNESKAEVVTEETPEVSAGASPFSEMKLEGRVARGRKKTSSKPKLPIGMIAGGGAVAVVVVLAAYFMGLFGGNSNATGPNKVGQSQQQKTAGGSGKQDAGKQDAGKTENGGDQQDESQGWVQKVVKDDGKLLWESPTTGPANSALSLPNGPSAILFLSPKLWEQKVTSKVLGAIDLKDSDASRFPDSLGFPSSFWKGWGQISVGIYPRDNSVFDRVFCLNGSQPVTVELSEWKAVEISAVDQDEKTCTVVLVNPNKKDFVAFCKTKSVPVQGLKAKSWDEIAKKLEPSDIIGNQSIDCTEMLVCDLTVAKRCTEEDARGSLDRVLNPLMEHTDQNRHVQFLFSPSTFKGEKGKWLMGNYWKQIPELHKLHWPLGVRSSYLSAHWDDEGACYLEAKFLLDSRQRDGGFLFGLNEKLSKLPTATELAIRKIPPHSSWDEVLVKYDDMVEDFVGRIRAGFHNKLPTINVWLPPNAERNLIVSSAVFLRANSHFGGALAGPTKKPAKKLSTIDDLLKVKWDLDIPEQDLVNAVAELKSGLVAEYKSLGFQFDLRLDGNALKMDGITQNQKITNFTAKQKTVAEILTQIAVTANPDQNVSKPNDAGCKLIWVVLKDGDKQSVLFTTRAAAKTNGWQLPKPFVLN